MGAPDAYAGEVPVAFAALHPGARADETELLAFAAAGVDEAPARPRYVRIIDALPTTNVGKVYKPRLRSMAAEIYARTLVAQAHERMGLPLPPADSTTHAEGEGFVLRPARAADRSPWEQAAEALAFRGEPVRIEDAA